MASNLRVDTILPSTGTTLGIGTASGTINFLGNSNLTTTGDVTVGGNLGVGGTLTYEDVTNIDSVGVITARTNINIGDSIIHIGDTNTKIRFPEADAVTIETNGSERLRINSAGSWGIGANFGTSGQVLTSQGNSSAPTWATPSTLSWTEHATFDFASTAASAATTTGIPSTARMVKINVFRLKHSATQAPYLRIGSSSGMHASGYTDVGTYQQHNQNGANYVVRGIRQTVGWAPFHWDFNNNTNRYSGTIELNRIGSTRWTYFSNIDVGYPSPENNQYINMMHGHNETFNATLDRVTLYMASGNFDEGYVSILSLS